MSALKKYDPETQARAVRMYADRIAEGDISQLRAREEIGELLGINQSTLRNWIRRDLGEGSTPAVPEQVDDEVVQLRREVARLRRANDILKTASAFFAAAELDRKLGQ
jgi:transposase